MKQTDVIALRNNLLCVKGRSPG